jgi:hypothetical protein
MTDTKGYGCGIYPLIIKDPEFEEACVWHDKAYSTNSFAEHNLSRLRTDQHFRDMMLYRAGASLVLQAKAWLYYSMARAFGAKWWEGKL